MVVGYVLAGGWCRDESLQETPKLSAVKIEPNNHKPLNPNSRTPKLHIAHPRTRKQPGQGGKEARGFIAGGRRDARRGETTPPINAAKAQGDEKNQAS